MSTVKSSSEDLTLNADGSGNDVVIQGNGTNTATITAEGLLKYNSGYGSVATAYGVRAWVNFDGIGTVAIRESGNVSSITDVAVGKFRVNFSTNMPDVNYAPIVATNYDDAGARAYSDVYTLAVGSFDISVRSAANNALLDPEGSYAAVIR